MAPDDDAWYVLELSEKYGTLRERTAILVLAEAFFSAYQILDFRTGNPGDP
jgi:CheY-like chemotaxis protein